MDRSKINTCERCIYKGHPHIMRVQPPKYPSILLCDDCFEEITWATAHLKR